MKILPYSSNPFGGVILSSNDIPLSSVGKRKFQGSLVRIRFEQIFFSPNCCKFGV